MRPSRLAHRSPTGNGAAVPTTPLPTSPDLPIAGDDPKLRHYPEARFGGFSDIDQMVLFYIRVRALLQPSFSVLDIGCGRGRHAEDHSSLRTRLTTLRGACRQIIGIDLDPAAEANPLVDEFRLIVPEKPWPLADASVDLAVSDYVLEHVEDPDAFFAECRRVIRPGGYLCMRTTNAMSYFGLAARLTLPTPALSYRSLLIGSCRSA